MYIRWELQNMIICFWNCYCVICSAILGFRKDGWNWFIEQGFFTDGSINEDFRRILWGALPFILPTSRYREIGDYQGETWYEEGYDEEGSRSRTPLSLRLLKWRVLVVTGDIHCSSMRLPLVEHQLSDPLISRRPWTFISGASNGSGELGFSKKFSNLKEWGAPLLLSGAIATFRRRSTAQYRRTTCSKAYNTYLSDFHRRIIDCS